VLLLAAADGDYDKREVKILKQIAKKAEVSNDELKEIFDWVSKDGNGIKVQAVF
jgi:hypothetical protein